MRPLGETEPQSLVEEGNPMRHDIHHRHRSAATGLRDQASPSRIRSERAVVARGYAIPVVRELPRRTDGAQIDSSTW